RPPLRRDQHKRTPLPNSPFSAQRIHFRSPHDIEPQRKVHWSLLLSRPDTKLLEIGRSRFTSSHRESSLFHEGSFSVQTKGDPFFLDLFYQRKGNAEMHSKTDSVGELVSS